MLLLWTPAPSDGLVAAAVEAEKRGIRSCIEALPVRKPLVRDTFATCIMAAAADASLGTQALILGVQRNVGVSIPGGQFSWMAIRYGPQSSPLLHPLFLLAVFDMV